MRKSVVAIDIKDFKQLHGNYFDTEDKREISLSIKFDSGTGIEHQLDSNQNKVID